MGIGGQRRKVAELVVEQKAAGQARVGGILSGEHAVTKIKSGATLVQIYTGLIYRGPALVPEVARALRRCAHLDLSLLRAPAARRVHHGRMTYSATMSWSAVLQALRAAASCAALVLVLAACAAAPDAAPDATARALSSQSLLPFASEEGLARLARASAKADFPLLANQFEAQSNAAFCGPTTAAIVLNALRGRTSELPRDRSRLREADLLHLPRTVDLALPRYTQDNVLDKSPKTRSQVLGEPMLVEGRPIRDVGFQTRQFDALLRAHGVRTRLVIVDDVRSEQAIRDELRDNLARAGDFVVVTYLRRAVGQDGGGHISPLGAYDAVSDSFLVLDVNPVSAGWVWMPTPTLVKGMRSFDTVENRGYVVVATP